MTQIKICGITNEEDALCAAGCGADAMGFIFYPPSPRYIAPAEALRIIKELPANIASVGVFVNVAEEEVARISELCISISFNSMVMSPSNCAMKMIYTMLLNTNVAAILVDSRHAGLYGGTGKKSNWDLALQIKTKKPLILSGGLNANNIGEALEKVAPHALESTAAWK